MIWDEFLRHFRFCDEEDSGLSDEYLTKNRSGKDQKIAQSTHEKGYIKPRKTFWRNSKQLLNIRTQTTLKINYKIICVNLRKSAFQRLKNLKT